jgi:4-amino-4-deoxy-L-arabinose transferase-like glycosyltransferase
MPLPVHFTAWGYGQMSVLMSYLMVPFIRLFGLSPFTARLPMLLVSLVGLAVLYVFIREAVGRREALAALALAAISPWHIMQSRWALDCNMFPHFMLFGIYFLYKGIKGKPYWLYGSMVFFALSLYAYGIALYTIPLFLLCAAVYMLIQNFKENILKIAVSLAVFLLFSWPILAMAYINYFDKPTFTFLGFTIPHFPHSVRVNDLLPFSPEPWVQFIQNAQNLGRILLFQDDRLPWNAVSGYGAVYLISLPFTLLGLWECIKRRRETGAALVLMWFAVAVCTGLFVNGVNINRINVIFYPLILLTALGVAGVAVNVKVMSSVAVAYAILFILFANTYFKGHNDWLSNLFYADFHRSVAHAAERGYGHLYVTAHTQFQGSWHVSEILTQFTTKIDPKFYAEHGAAHFTFSSRFDVYTRLCAQHPPHCHCLFILNRREAHFFEGFTITWFNDFGVAERTR